jgi:hypothetical protein
MGLCDQQHATAALTLEGGPVPILQVAGWALGRGGRVRKTSLPLGFDPQSVQPVASRYTDYAFSDHVVDRTVGLIVREV